MYKQVFVCFFSFFAMFPCWTYFVRLAASSQVMKHLQRILMWTPPHTHTTTTTTKVLLSTVYISISFPFLFDAYRHSVSYLCYIHWYAKINTLNICNHLATSYSHIPKTCAFDYYTNTCIHINLLWSKHLFFSMLRYKNSCIISISFQEFGATHSTHANTHMKGINFTLNLLQSFIYNPLLNMAMLSKTYAYILYNKQSFESQQHSS